MAIISSMLILFNILLSYSHRLLQIFTRTKHFIKLRFHTYLKLETECFAKVFWIIYILYYCIICIYYIKNNIIKGSTELNILIINNNNIIYIAILHISPLLNSLHILYIMYNKNILLRGPVTDFQIFRNSTKFEN